VVAIVEAYVPAPKAVHAAANAAPRCVESVNRC